jgi:lysyl-tRNA synthetase class 2
MAHTTAKDIAQNEQQASRSETPPSTEPPAGDEAPAGSVAPAGSGLPAGDGPLTSDRAPARNEEPVGSVEPVTDAASSGVNERVEKMSRLRLEGREPYPHVRVPHRAHVSMVLEAHHPSELEHGEHPTLRYTLAGRLTSRRVHGRRAFLDLRDDTGEIQLYAQSDVLGEDSYQQLLRLDIGDIISANGCVYLTQRGEIVLSVRGFQLLTKSLRPPPSRFHGVEDAGTRHRYRELDLMANQETRQLFFTRAKTVEALRSFLARKGFTEVETPVLQSLAGGASARPFTTHHNALDVDLSLRISVELYLNRCLIGGLENVYDLGKCFRNEGISYRHSPEFTMLEWLQSYADHTDVANFTEEMIASVATEVLGTTEVKRAGETIDLSRWERTTMQEVIAGRLSIDILESSTSELLELLADHREQIDDRSSWAQAVHTIYTKLVEHTIIAPTLVFDFPVEMFPITKRHRDDPRLAEHFDAVVAGIELVSGDSELTDPIEQRRRFLEQRERRGEQANEAHPHDEEYVRALEYGLPPSASGGMGVDRLLMILTGRQHLREVLPFPTLRERQ